MRFYFSEDEWADFSTDYESQKKLFLSYYEQSGTFLENMSKLKRSVWKPGDTEFDFLELLETWSEDAVTRAYLTEEAINAMKEDVDSGT